MMQPEHLLSMPTALESVSNGSHSLVLFSMRLLVDIAIVTIAMNWTGHGEYREEL